MVLNSARDILLSPSWIKYLNMRINYSLTHLVTLKEDSSSSAGVKITCEKLKNVKQALIYCPNAPSINRPFSITCQWELWLANFLWHWLLWHFMTNWDKTLPYKTHQSQEIHLHPSPSSWKLSPPFPSPLAEDSPWYGCSNSNMSGTGRDHYRTAQQVRLWRVSQNSESHPSPRFLVQPFVMKIQQLMFYCIFHELLPANPTFRICQDLCSLLVIFYLEMEKMWLNFKTQFILSL